MGAEKGLETFLYGINTTLDLRGQVAVNQMNTWGNEISRHEERVCKATELWEDTALLGSRKHIRMAAALSMRTRQAER